MGDSQNTESNTLSDGIDPEIAKLIGVEDTGESADAPVFDDLFEEPGETQEVEKEDIDLSKKSFTPISKFEEDSKPYFQDKNYYKTALGGEGDSSKRVHQYLALFLNAKDPQERSVHRGRLVAAYWNYLESIAKRSHASLPTPKKLAMRFNLILPTLLTPEQRGMISKIIAENDTGEPVNYIDEWIHKIALGQVTASATDEIKVKKQDDNSQITAKIERSQGLRDVQFGLLSNKLLEMDSTEQQLTQTIQSLASRSDNPAHPGLKYGYASEQRSMLSEVGNLTRTLSNIDKEVDKLYRQLDGAAETLESLKDKASEAGPISIVDNQTLADEFNTVRQMAKMCVGRQGNHMPILMKQYFRPNIRDIGTRENVIAAMTEVEQIDPGIFLRTFKRQTNRIVPYVILIPCYGDLGMCWEPFERFNRATSRGRIAIPIFPKDVKVAVITALADLRWQVAKEKAQHYWMEEGLTGSYYQWFSGKKMRGDVREAFIQDYQLWINKESEGTQKLDKDVRGVFWRHIPFRQDIKENLKNRGFVYSELYKRDKNREMSDGY